MVKARSETITIVTNLSILKKPRIILIKSLECSSEDKNIMDFNLILLDTRQ